MQCIIGLGRWPIRHHYRKHAARRPWARRQQSLITQGVDRATCQNPQNLEQCSERVNLAGEEARHFSHPRPRSDTLEPRAVMQRATRNTLYGAEK